MENPITPEERLLKLIKEGAKPDQARTEDNPANKPAAGEEGPQAQEAPDAEKKPSFQERFDIKTIFTAANLSRFLTGVFAVTFLIVIINAALLLAPSARMQDIDIDTGLKAAGVSAEPARHKPVKQLSDYTSQIRSRALFKSVMLKKTASAGPSQVKIKLQEAAQSLSVKGIVSGAQPQAVIEDTKTQRSYFVREGEKVAADIVIDKIMDNKVRLKLGSEYYDLTL